MKTDKEKQIEEWLARPIQVGDAVYADVPYVQKKRLKEHGKFVVIEITEMSKIYGQVEDVANDPEYGKLVQIETAHTSKPFDAIGLPMNYAPAGKKSGYHKEWYLLSWVTPDTSGIGEDPFQDAPRINFYNQTIESLLSNAGYGRRSDFFNDFEREPIDRTNPDKGTYGGCDFNPYVIDKNGDRKHYQRGLVWTEEQKRDLITTIYKGGDIGKFVFRYKKWSDVEKQASEDGHGFNWDVVDGKQRMHAILEFVQGKFTDKHGNFWKDLSGKAQSKFMMYDKLSFGKLDMDTTDEQAIAAFLYVNVNGTPVSEEHIYSVSTIELK